MVKEDWALRGQCMMKATVYAMAKQFYDEVLGNIPSGSEYKEFTESLKISEISGFKKSDGGGYAVHIPSKGRRVSKVDVDRTVIYVRVKTRLRKNRKDLIYLEDNGPWTVDTIPFWPSYKEAAVVQRKVTKREADAVAKRQKKVALKVKRDLAELGKKYARKKDGQDGSIKRDSKKAIPDLAMQGLNMEFGMSGERSTPVFRPAIRAIKDGAKRIPYRVRVIREAMLDPNTQRWKTWPPRQDKISPKEAATFNGFMKRLGYG